mmetsp:Transcript_13933/g.31913  ORF Transcript_13933/g.31913 Transcript_13933/m.31913 type:complete len:90 (+) Transcript_13933:3-272(+)
MGVPIGLPMGVGMGMGVGVKRTFDQSENGQQQQQQQLKRRHSIDVPHMHWHKRSYPDLSNLDTAEDDDDRGTNLSSRDRANEKLNFSSF